MVNFQILTVFLILGISSVWSVRRTDNFKKPSINTRPPSSQEVRHAIQDHVKRPRGTCQRPPPEIPSDNDVAKLSLWDLLIKTENDMTVHTGDAIVLLGNTGSGKTTVVLSVTGNMSKLQVYETSGEELIIVDPDQKIGITTASRTLVPELVPDPPNSLYYFDFPGFSDNRGSNADITANYLMKKVTDTLSSIRLGFIVTENSVGLGKEKTDFDKLVLSAIQMVRNLEKFEAGIGMIVTKVNNYNRRGKFRDDTVILTGVTEFLHQYKLDEEKKLNEVRKRGQTPLKASQRETIERKIKFVEILLQPNKMWFWRQPEDCGPLSETSWAEENKQAIILLVKDHLKSIPTTKGEFGYAISDTTFVQVYSLYEDLNSYVTSNITSLVDNLRKAHFQNTLTVRKFYAQAQWISDDLGNFTSVVNSFQNKSKSPGDLSDLLASAIDLRGYEQRWGLQLKTELRRIESYMDFFDQVNKEGSAFPRDEKNWIVPLINWVNEVSQRNEWFTFLNSLRSVLSSYTFQKKPKPSSSPRNLLDLQQILGEDSHLVTSLIISIYDKMKSIVPQDVDILWSIVDEALRVPKFTCDQSTKQMTVQGTFIKASEFTDSSGSYSGCSYTPLTVSILATRSVFFDTTVRPSKPEDLSLELAVIAPVWEVVVIGNKDLKIDLQGKSGLSSSRQLTSSHHNRSVRAIVTSIPPMIQSKCDQKPKAKDGKDGGNGSPGKPGTPGGHFIGMASQVKDGAKLEVIASGGSGGAGQPGASGGDGEKGKFYGTDEWGTCHATGPCNNDCKKTSATCATGNWQRYFDTCWRKESRVIECFAYGCLGGRGGNGGNGGVGGKGGYPGKISLVIFGADGGSGRIRTTAFLGKIGTDGRGGSLGIGGRRGDGNKAGITGMWNCLCSWEDYAVSSPDKWSPSGSEGKTGGNSVGAKDPKQPTFTLAHSQLVLNYKKFALPEESEIFPNDFIDQLEAHPEVTKGHSPIYFAQELLILEDLNLQLKNEKMEEEPLTLRLLPHYESFIRRLDHFTVSHEDFRNSLGDADRKFISLIYTMGLNQLRNLRMVFGTPVIVNVEGYLESVGIRLQEYEKTETKVMVAEERARYKETFTQKIEQAMVMLVETVDPALNETYGEIGQVTQQLREAVEKMIEAAEAAEKEYKEALDKMKKTIGLRSVINIFKIGGAALSILGGPVAGSIGSIIGSASSMAEGMALDSGGNLRPPTPLPPSIKKYAEEMERRNKVTSQDREDELDTLIKESRTAVKDNVQALNQLETKIVVLEERKKTLVEKGPKSSMKQFQDFNQKVKDSERDLKATLTQRVEDLEKAMAGLEGSPAEQEVAKEFGEKAIESLKHVDSAVKIVSKLRLDIYNSHKKDKKEIARLSAMVEEAHEQLKDLKKYEQSVDDILVPFTDSIIFEMDEAAAHMANQSPVFLRVTEWMVQKTLREYNFFLQDFSQAFPDVARQYALQVENLKEAMTIMIDLYDFIQQYNEQMQFADYIANINSPRASQAVLGEPAHSLYEKIDIAMQASLILTDYFRVIQTFKQWVYPFAEAFKGELQTSKIPDYMKPAILDASEMHTILIPDIVRRVTLLTASLKTYKSAAFEAVDGVLIHTEFNSEKVSTVPFHVWRSENEEKRIKQLLLGNQVTFSVTPESTYKKLMSAVKFTIAEIEPKALNETLQIELKEKLKYLRVIMTHSGVSRYLYNEEMEEMVGGNLTIQYNFERDDNGERLGKNNVYKKLELGDLILSPYTLWTVQLRPAQNDVPFDFEELAKYSSFVDLELVGKGSFVRPKGTRKAFRPVPLRAFTSRRSPFE